MYGYAGSILRVDLTEKKVKKDVLTEDFARKYVGGRGFVAKILFDEVPAGADPLGPDNVLVIASGPLSGSMTPGGAKVHMGAKSPATGGYGDSNMGGHLAAEMKFAGYDAVVIRGKSTNPCYVVIDDDRVEIREAGELWGKGAMTAEKMLKDMLGEEFQVMVIGPAGEKAVKYACICHDFGRQSGRTGLGAVMGSKGVKAVAFRGTKSLLPARPGEMKKIADDMHRHCQSHPVFKEWQDYGTASVTKWVNSIGCFPTKNFYTSYYEGHEKFSGELMRESIVVTDKACFSCPLNCGKYSKVSFKGNDVYVEGPEYETTGLIGGNCALNSIEEVAIANYICDELGLDTISFGNVAGFVMECFEKGIFKAGDFEDRQIKFGSLDALIYLAEIIANRKGIGNLLAEGVRAIAREVGQGSMDYAMQVKGLEFSGYESRNAPAMLLSYMTCDIGAHHSRSWAVTFDIAQGRAKTDGKAAQVIIYQHTRPLFDMLGVCRLHWIELEMDVNSYASMYSAFTGIDMTWDDLMKCSERVWNLTRMFWIREEPGFGREYDMPPARVYTEKTPSGPSQGTIMSLDDINYMLDDYYKLRGWDRDGRPTPEKLSDLEIGDAAALLMG